MPQEVWSNEFGIYISRILCPNGCNNTICKNNFCDGETNHGGFGVWEIDCEFFDSDVRKPICCRCNYEKFTKHSKK